MKIVERSQERQVHSLYETQPAQGERSSATLGTLPPTRIPTFLSRRRHEVGVPCTPTSSGRYTSLFFHIPHNTAAWLRATLRRAMRGVNPS